LKTSTICTDVRAQFADYLDGTLTGVAMQSLTLHTDACASCTEELARWQQMQNALAALGRAPAPHNLQQRLRAALSEERARGAHLGFAARIARAWQAYMAPLAFRAAMGTVAALVLLAGVSALVTAATPSAVEANDQPLGALTAPHYLYSEVPPVAIDTGREVPILVEARVDERGRVYDYAILTGPTDDHVQRRVQANLLAAVFQPATAFGVPVPGRVVMTYSGVVVHG
jgi:anti-sigma factor RsiW